MNEKDNFHEDTTSNTEYKCQDDKEMVLNQLNPEGKIHENNERKGVSIETPSPPAAKENEKTNEEEMTDFDIKSNTSKKLRKQKIKQIEPEEDDEEDEVIKKLKSHGMFLG